MQIHPFLLCVHSQRRNRPLCQPISTTVVAPFFFFEEKQLLHLNDARLPVSQVEKTSLPQASRPGRGHDIKTSCKATTRDIFACSHLVLLEHSTMWPDMHTTDQAVTLSVHAAPQNLLRILQFYHKTVYLSLKPRHDMIRQSTEGKTLKPAMRCHLKLVR
jgi:hypothetical protein